MSYINLYVGLFFTVLVVAASIGGLLAVRRWLQAIDLKSNHDVTDPLSQVVGMMFAVLLGFMVSDAMQRFEQARATVQQEAASLADVFSLAEGMPEARRAKMRALCYQYADLVVHEEWPLWEQRS